MEHSRLEFGGEFRYFKEDGAIGHSNDIDYEKIEGYWVTMLHESGRIEKVWQKFDMKN